MSANVLPLVWLDAPGRSLPEGLPPLSDLAPAEPGGPRLAVLAQLVGSANASAAAARLAALSGCAAAGWLEPDRVVALRGGRPERVLRRVPGRWEGSLPLSSGAAAALGAARLRLGRAGRTHGGG